jgi:hypothetical protein
VQLVNDQIIEILRRQLSRGVLARPEVAGWDERLFNETGIVEVFRQLIGIGHN